MFSLSRSFNYLKILLLLRGKLLFGSHLAILVISFLGIYIVYRISQATTVIPTEKFILPFLFGINLAWILNLAVQSAKSFKDIHNSSKMMGEFVMPISHFERFTVNKTFYGGGTLLFMLIANLFLIVGVSWIFDQPLSFYFEQIPTWAYLSIFYYFVLIFCFFFAGSIYLKSAFLKVIILILALNIAISLISDNSIYTNFETKLNTWFSSDVSTDTSQLNDSNSSSNYSITDESKQLSGSLDISVGNTLSEENSISLKKILLILIGLLFYTASYFRLKRIQLK